MKDSYNCQQHKHFTHFSMLVMSAFSPKAFHCLCVACVCVCVCVCVHAHTKHYESTNHTVTALSCCKIQLLVYSMQNAFPARFKGVYIINQPWYMSIPLSIVRPFLSEKIKTRVRVKIDFFNFCSLFRHRLTCWEGKQIPSAILILSQRVSQRSLVERAEPTMARSGRN